MPCVYARALAAIILFWVPARKLYLGGCPVCHSVSGHEVGLRMEGELPEGQPRLRRRVALCVRPERLQHFDGILHHTCMLRRATSFYSACPYTNGPLLSSSVPEQQLVTSGMCGRDDKHIIEQGCHACTPPCQPVNRRNHSSKQAVVRHVITILAHKLGSQPMF